MPEFETHCIRIEISDVERAEVPQPDIRVPENRDEDVVVARVGKPLEAVKNLNSATRPEVFVSRFILRFDLGKAYPLAGRRAGDEARRRTGPDPAQRT